MAVRPLFVPSSKGSGLVERLDLEFQWHAGLAVTQKQKSIRCLHESASQKGFKQVLEISSKSENPLGVRLSAFNLRYRLPDGKQVSVENVFQAGKCFERGGPFRDLLGKTAREAKQDPRLGSSGNLLAFDLNGEKWPLLPVTAFYDWVYLSALKQSPTLAEELLAFDGFTDIEFNPERSLNCQAASAALFVALARKGELDATLASRDSFLVRLGVPNTRASAVQSSLF
ncbi:hypothetical protein [Azoarcus sp. KH32C]|uniref:DarT1-associated NADAR antitoxin family protein n=1 Tax=Azoarcus sp. KH32C TaxID=748247 RepID=UPI0005A2AE26|nr:hypothetical protein [Azoarcus sp. KH32C]